MYGKICLFAFKYFLCVYVWAWVCACEPECVHVSLSLCMWSLYMWSWVCACEPECICEFECMCVILSVCVPECVHVSPSVCCESDCMCEHHLLNSFRRGQKKHCMSWNQSFALSCSKMYLFLSLCVLQVPKEARKRCQMFWSYSYEPPSGGAGIPTPVLCNNSQCS